LWNLNVYVSWLLLLLLTLLPVVYVVVVWHDTCIVVVVGLATLYLYDHEESQVAS
jgi:hypothetical protein